MINHAPSSHLLAHCPLCQVAYEKQGVRLLGERGATRLFHCTCNACGHSILAVILEAQGSVSSVGMVTDLEVQDVLRFRELEPLTDDDCIATHRVLSRQSAEFCRLLKAA